MEPAEHRSLLTQPGQCPDAVGVWTWERVAPLRRSAEHTPRLCFQGRVSLPSLRYGLAPAAREAVSWPTSRVHSHRAGCQVWLASGQAEDKEGFKPEGRAVLGCTPGPISTPSQWPSLRRHASRLPSHWDLAILSRCQLSRCLASSLSAEFRPHLPLWPTLPPVSLFFHLTPATHRTSGPPVPCLPVVPTLDT